MSWRGVFIVLLLAALFVLLFKQGVSGSAPQEKSFSYLLSQFEPSVDRPAFKRVEVDLTRGRALCYADEEQAAPLFYVNIPPQTDLAGKLLRPSGDRGPLNTMIDVRIAPRRFSEAWVQVIGYIVLPIVLVLFLYIVFVKQMQASGGQAITFGKSRHQRYHSSFEQVTFDDVAGADEAKEELAEVVEFLKEPEKFRAVGARIPTGVLLTGPPGCGKTLLARAIAGEANVPFLYISGSDFVEMFVGVGASRVRDLFEQAKHHERSIVFIDEIDAVGRHRGTGIGGGHDEREQTLNQLLVEMDGFDKNTGVIILAATNRADVLDPALLRPGRFDRHIVIDMPDVRGREAIFRIYVRERPVAEDIDIETLAKRTPGFSGADIEILVNEGAILAARRNRTRIEFVDLEDAIDRVSLGLERKSRVLSDEERYALAVHETGHALVGMSVLESDPIHKVSIVSRGQALGYTMHLPKDEHHMYSENYLRSRIAATLGGRAAEQIVLGKLYSGAADDLAKVTDLARAMVCTLGMSERLGPMAIEKSERHMFLGRELQEDRHVSEDTARLVDEEVRSIVEGCYAHATEVIAAHRHALDVVVEALLEKETLQGEDLEAMVRAADEAAGVAPLGPPGTVEPVGFEAEARTPEIS
jgi:cell division protease FtsH